MTAADQATAARNAPRVTVVLLVDPAARVNPVVLASKAELVIKALVESPVLLVLTEPLVTRAPVVPKVAADPLDRLGRRVSSHLK